MFRILRTGITENVDLNMYQCGTQNCEPGHEYGPAVRDHFLIHYVSEGEGVFRVDGNTYRLGKDHGFLIYPNVISYYRADGRNPWAYSWVGFNGLKAEQYLGLAGLSRQNPIFTYDSDSYLKQLFDEMVESRYQKSGRDLKLVGLLYVFISKLIEINGSQKFIDVPTTGRAEYYVNKAVRYMQMNYSHKINISEIAANIGLDRSYLGCIFRKKHGVSPQEYLLKLRIEKSCRLMGNKELSIGDISRSVGYNDPLHFSKIFKKEKGIPPSQFRKKLLGNTDSSNRCL